MADYSYIAIEKSGKRNKRKYGIGQQGKSRTETAFAGVYSIRDQRTECLTKKILRSAWAKKSRQEIKRVLPSVCKYAPCRSKYSERIRYAVDTDRK